jgi:glycosyltransferase involved in cell wall biosynthesis
MEVGGVTLIAPMLDEARHVEWFVADVAAQDYDGPLDLVVADGGSTDDSRALLESAAAASGVRLAIVDNPERLVSPGLNRCVRAATGDLLVRLDLHTRYPPDYVRRCVEASEVTGAWNVGGVLVPQGVTRTERAVAAAMDGPFGGIGWTRSAGPERVETDTVSFGAYRREVFEVAGLFDESLVRNQDDELNLRIRLAGGRIVLDPAIRSYYVPRGRLRSVWRQYYEYGRWKIPVMRKHKRMLGARSLAPSVFVFALVLLAALAAVFRPAAWSLLGLLIAYAAAAAVFGLRSLRARAEPLALLPRVVGAYLAFHLGYGIGMLRGLLPR